MSTSKTRRAAGRAYLVLALLACLSLTACRSGQKESTSPSESPLPPFCSAHGTSLTVTAKDLTYSTDCMAVPVGTAFTITFTNQDPGVRHNVAIHTGYERYSVPAPWLFMGDPVVGPGTVTYHVGGLPAGRYVFLCDFHHDQMTGHFLVPGN